MDTSEDKIETKTTVEFADFQKLDLRTAKIITAERVINSEKLIRLEILVGAEKRQIVSGIGKSYAPETLIGKMIIIVVNLTPRKLMGLESNGMLLAAHDENGLPVLLSLEREVPPGSKIN